MASTTLPNGDGCDRRRHRAVASVRLLVLLGLFAVSVGACSTTEDPAAAPTPSTFPDVALVDLRTGDAAPLDRYLGTPVVVNLWAAWCTPCRAEMPELDAAQQRFADRIQVVGVTDAIDPDASLAAADATGVGYPLLIDTDERLQSALGVTALPATAFLDADGHLVELHAGVLDATSLDETIGRLYGIS